MYRTIKIRLKATKAQKEHFFTYEAEYHQQLDSLVAQMRTHPYNVKFKDISIAESIAAHSRWTLYQLALKMHNREKEQKRTGYNKSSTWSPRSFTINKDRLTLHYGKQFSHRKDTVTLKRLLLVMQARPRTMRSMRLYGWILCMMSISGMRIFLSVFVLIREIV